MERDVAIVALVQRVEAKEVCASSCRRGGALGCPREGRTVVAGEP